MSNKNKTVWSTRFDGTSSKIFEQIGASIDVDKRLFNEDILGSIVHTQMLVKQKIINKKRGKKIIFGLKKIRNEIRKNKFIFNKKYEDIHLNIEKRLFSIIGKFCTKKRIQKIFSFIFFKSNGCSFFASTPFT